MILKSLSFVAAASQVALAASVSVDPKLAGCKAIEKIGKTKVHYPSKHCILPRLQQT